jgi:purine-binding chemotaxis protein CheW
MRSSGYATDPDIRELVAFRTAGQDFCIDILSVREIRGWSRPALLPHAPTYVQGVINLRGAVVPILDQAGP